MMVVVQPVSGVADTWKLVPASRASQRIRGGVPLLLRTALAYSGGESLGDSLLNFGDSFSSSMALFAISIGFPMPLQALVICPGLLHFPQVTESFLILQSRVFVVWIIAPVAPRLVSARLLWSLVFASDWWAIYCGICFRVLCRCESSCGVHFRLKGVNFVA